MYIDPVTTVDGSTYERAYIEKWLETKDTDPFIDTKLPSKCLQPNMEIQQAAEEFRMSLAMYFPSSSPKPSSEVDRQKALRVRIMELESAYQARLKMHTLVAELVDIELCILECIPHDLTEQQLADLATTTTSTSSHYNIDHHRRVEVLREQLRINRSLPTLQYYMTLQVSIIGMLHACTAISWGMAVNRHRGVTGSIAAAIEAFIPIADPSSLAEHGLRVLITTLDKCDLIDKKHAVDRVMKVFMGDHTTISVVAERVARQMALHRQAELEQQVDDSRVENRSTVRMGLRMAMSMCYNISMDTDSKVRAFTDAVTVIEGVMKGNLVIKPRSSTTTTTTTAAEWMDTITTAFVAFVRYRGDHIEEDHCAVIDMSEYF